MKHHKYTTPVFNNSGSTLIVMLLVMVSLTAVCLLASNISVYEMQVAGNDKFYRVAFYNADGSIYGVAKLISGIHDDGKIEAGPGETAPGISYLNTESDPAEQFLQQLLNKANKPNADDVDIEFIQPDPSNPYNLQSRVIVNRIDTIIQAGGGAEFGNASEGAAAQAFFERYRLRAEGQNPSNTTKSNVIAEYWKNPTKGWPGL